MAGKISFDHPEKHEVTLTVRTVGNDLRKTIEDAAADGVLTAGEKQPLQQAAPSLAV